MKASVAPSMSQQRKSSLPRLVGGAMVALLLTISGHVLLSADQGPHGAQNVPPQAGPNHNLASGVVGRFDPTDPAARAAAQVKSDLLLQRQNEVTGAASTRNPAHHLYAANDYRGVDIASDPFLGDANPGIFTWLMAKLFRRPMPIHPPKQSAGTVGGWIGVYRSCDGGHTVIGGVLPGSPIDGSEASMASPLKTLGPNAESTDPVLAAGPKGRVYLAGVGFVRNGGDNRIFVARYTDRNHHEGGACFFYEFTTIVDRGTTDFLDKPSIAVDKNGFIYVAYTQFVDSANSKLRIARSTDEGVTFKVVEPKINIGFLRNHGTSIAIDQIDGTVYVAWRLFYADWPLMAMVKSMDFGRTYFPPIPIVHLTGFSLGSIVNQLKAQKLKPFDQFTGQAPNYAFRSLAFPSIAAPVVNGRTRLVVVWQELADMRPGSTFGLPYSGPGSSPRIMATWSTTGGLFWSQRRAIDAGQRVEREPGLNDAPILARPSGPQVQPVVIDTGGNNSPLLVAYYEARGEIDPDGRIGGIDRRMDLRIAKLDPVLMRLSAPSVQVSQYAIQANSNPARLVETAPGYQAVSRPNVPMYQGGWAPFWGDYPSMFKTTAFETGSPWKFTTESSPVVTVFTDNRNMKFPLDGNGVSSINGDWTQYSPVGTSTCGNPGSRNADPYGSEVAGVVATSPQTFKPLTIQRAFVASVENRTPADRFFRLTIVDNELAGVDGSFDQFSFAEANDTIDVKILANSNHTRSLWVNPVADPALQAAPVRVLVQEIIRQSGAWAIKPDGLRTRLILNPDPTNNDLENLQDDAPIDTFELHDPSISDSRVSTFEIDSPKSSAPQIDTPQIDTPQIDTPQIDTSSETSNQVSSPQIDTPQIDTVSPEENGTDVTYTVTNGGNTSSSYHAAFDVPNVRDLISSGNYHFQVLITRTSFSPGVIAGAAGCEQARIPRVRVVGNVPVTQNTPAPQIDTPQIDTPELATINNPQIDTPQIDTPQIATFALEPEAGATGQNSHARDDDLEDAHSTVLPASLDITLRAIRLKPMSAGGPLFNPNTVKLRVQADSTNVINGVVQEDGTQPLAFAQPDLVIVNYTPATDILTAAPGKEVTLSSWTLRNQGDGPSTLFEAQSAIAYAISTDPEITNDDIVIGTDSFGVLPVGAEINYDNRTLTIPTDIAPGSYYIGIVVDRSNQVDESDETNNDVSEPIEITAAAGGPAVWLLDNSDPSITSPEPNDQLVTLDEDGESLESTGGLGICEAIGAWRALDVAASGRYAVVAQFCRPTGNKLTKIAADGTGEWSVPISNAAAVDISANGKVYVLTGTTRTGNSILIVDSDGETIDGSEVGGVDLVVDDPNDAVWIVGDQIRKLDRNLEFQFAVTDPNPITFAAVSVDVAADGSAWVAERRGSEPNGQNRLLKIDPIEGIILEAVTLPAEPFSVRVHRASGSVWVAMSNQIHKYASNGEQLVNQETGVGWSLAVNQTDGSVWASYQDGTVIHYASDGEILQLIERSGFEDVETWVGVPIP